MDHLTAVTVLWAALLGIAGDDSYRAEIEAYRSDHEAELRAEDGWLTVVGLHWLGDGSSTIGSAPDSDVVLPASAPARFGVLEVAGEKVSLRLEPAASATRDGESFEQAQLQLPDAEGRHAVVLGDVSFHLLRRGNRLGLRVRDRNSHERRSFGGLKWFDIEPGFRVEAKFVVDPGKVPVANIIGLIHEYESPGYVTFTRDGAPARLRPVYETAKKADLFFIFRDATSGRSTYPAGRFLHTPLPVDGEVDLDFNRAYSPPCAFTEHATCPLPPQENWLSAAIEAGEQDPGTH